MLNYSVNIVAVIVAAVINIVIGFMWYGPLFGEKWAKGVGFSKKDMENMKKADMKKPMIINLITTLITVYIAAVLLSALGISTTSAAIVFGVLVWAGFYFGKNVGSVLWEQKPVDVLYINGAFDLVMIVVTVIVLTLIG